VADLSQRQLHALALQQRVYLAFWRRKAASASNWGTTEENLAIDDNLGKMLPAVEER